jgi:hypothetical protein
MLQVEVGGRHNSICVHLQRLAESGLCFLGRESQWVCAGAGRSVCDSLSRSKYYQIGVPYGIHGDAQRDLLLKVEEAKEFAKAVKADDGEIPLFLWNNWIKAPGVPEARKDAALDSF